MAIGAVSFYTDDLREQWNRLSQAYKKKPNEAQQSHFVNTLRRSVRITSQLQKQKRRKAYNFRGLQSKSPNRIDSLTVLITDSADGGKKAIGAKKQTTR